ncbi:MAG: transcription termination/antitermination protein NusG [Candidatus Babeliales bacterium]
MKRWYVIQAFAGYEEAIKKDIEKRIVETGLEPYFGQVLIPSAKVKTLFEPEPDTASKAANQLFPGYLLIEMELRPETMRLVQATPRITRFLGGKEPVPLAQREIDRILSQMRGEIAVASKKSDFVSGAEVEISDGPFAGFVGLIKDVDEESERLTVEVSIFGRMTPIELGFNQVKW